MNTILERGLLLLATVRMSLDQSFHRRHKVFLDLHKLEPKEYWEAIKKELDQVQLLAKLIMPTTGMILSL